MSQLNPTSASTGKRRSKTFFLYFKVDSNSRPILVKGGYRAVKPHRVSDHIVTELKNLADAAGGVSDPQKKCNHVSFTCLLCLKSAIERCAATCTFQCGKMISTTEEFSFKKGAEPSLSVPEAMARSLLKQCASKGLFRVAFFKILLEGNTTDLRIIINLDPSSYSDSFLEEILDSTLNRGLLDSHKTILDLFPHKQQRFASGDSILEYIKSFHQGFPKLNGVNVYIPSPGPTPDITEETIKQLLPILRTGNKGVLIIPDVSGSATPGWLPQQRPQSPLMRQNKGEAGEMNVIQRLHEALQEVAAASGLKEKWRFFVFHNLPYFQDSTEGEFDVVVVCASLKTKQCGAIHIEVKATASENQIFKIDAKNLPHNVTVSAAKQLIKGREVLSKLCGNCDFSWIAKCIAYPGYSAQASPVKTLSAEARFSEFSEEIRKRDLEVEVQGRARKDCLKGVVPLFRHVLNTPSALQIFLKEELLQRASPSNAGGGHLLYVLSLLATGRLITSEKKRSEGNTIAVLKKEQLQVVNRVVQDSTAEILLVPGGSGTGKTFALLLTLLELKSRQKITSTRKAAILLPKACINLGRWLMRQMDCDCLDTSDCVDVILIDALCASLNLASYSYIFVDQFEEIPCSCRKDVLSLLDESPGPSCIRKIVLLANSEEWGYDSVVLRDLFRTWPVTFPLSARLRPTNRLSNFLDKVCPRTHWLQDGVEILNECTFPQPRAPDSHPTGIYYVSVDPLTSSTTEEGNLAKAVAETLEYAHTKHGINYENTTVVVDSSKCPLPILQEALSVACKTKPVSRRNTIIPRVPVIVQAPLLAPAGGPSSAEIPASWTDGMYQKIEKIGQAPTVSALEKELDGFGLSLATEREKLEHYASCWQKPIALLEFFLNKVVKNVSSLAASPTTDEIKIAVDPLVSSKPHLNFTQYNFIPVLESSSVGGYESPAVIGVWGGSVVPAQNSPLGRERTKWKNDTRSVSRATMFAFIIIPPEFETAETLRALSSAGAERLEFN